MEYGGSSTCTQPVPDMKPKNLGLLGLASGTTSEMTRG